MKANIIELKPKEKKAITIICEKMKVYEIMMETGSRGFGIAQDKLWKTLHGLYPEVEGQRDVSFNFKSKEIRFFSETEAVKRYRELKEKAIKDHEFHKAAEYRDLERKAKMKEGD